jgi:hypothetical protein
MENINPYNKEYFKEYFIKTDLCHKLIDGVDVVIWDKLSKNVLSHMGAPITPVQLRYERIVSVAPFYYLKFLTDANPTNIYDLGCGMNFYKKFISNIIGIGAEPIESIYYRGDVWGRFDDNYVLENQNKFESLFSIDAIHFTKLSNLRKITDQFISMVKPKGRGFLSLNVARMLEQLEPNEIKYIFNTGSPTTEQIDSYVRKELTNLSCNILCFDVDMSVIDDPILGNIRIVFEKE